jgi:hypothetical protein
MAADGFSWYARSRGTENRDASRELCFDPTLIYEAIAAYCFLIEKEVD